jgi:hypothetical protein
VLLILAKVNVATGVQWRFVDLFLLHGLISSYNNDLVGNLTD